MQTLRTERLVLRAPSLGDAEDYLRLNNDPQVTRYVRTTLPPERRELEEWIGGLSERFPAGSRRGVWAGEFRGDFLGSFMLRPARDTGELELGYRLMPQFWGQGLATEACLALLTLADGERVVARAHRDNAASLKVMRRLGMSLVREYQWEGVPSVEYAVCF